jgi:hypothetical protein
MRKFLLVAASVFGLATPARADTYVLQCALAQGCVAADGTTQPVGTYFSPTISYDGIATYHPAGMNVVLYASQTLYVPTAPAPAALTGAQLWARFTTAEQNAIMAYTSCGYCGTIITVATSPYVSSADPTIQGYFTTLVSNGLLTPARRTQILNFGVASP